MKGEIRQIRDELRNVFGLQEGPIGTGTVLLTPSTVLKAQAIDIARRCPLRGVLRDLGAVAAREVANEMQASGLRPADYADHREIADIVLERIAKMLLDDTGSEFAASVRDHLRVRG